MKKEVIHKQKSFFEKIKYNYKLLFDLNKIEIPKYLNQTDQEKYLKKIYHDKAKLHEKLGARWFQRIVEKVDKTKYKFLKKTIGEKKIIKLMDIVLDKNAKFSLKRVKTAQEKEEILEQLRRSKILIKKQFNEEKSINYYIGVDNRVEQFPKYLLQNKKIHQNCLIKNGIILGSCIISSMLGLPLIPLSILGSYQIIAAFKNIQCINIQEYNLSRIKIIEKKTVERNMKKLQKIHQSNQELIKTLKNQKEINQDFASFENIINNINNKEVLQQMRALLVPETNNQNNKVIHSK